MCVGGGSIPEQKTFQASKAPNFPSASGQPSTGRKGTILTGGSGLVDSAPTGKKTLLGQ